MEYSVVCPINVHSDTTITRNYYIIATKRLDALQKVLCTELNIEFTFEGEG